MPQEITVAAKGLATNPNYLNAPEGALSVADDVVISRPGVVEPRRGYDLYASSSQPVQKLIFLDHEINPRVLAFTGSAGGPWEYCWMSGTDSSASFVTISTVQPYGFLHSYQANQNLYFTTLSGVFRHAGDPSGTLPAEAGVFPGFIGNVGSTAPGSGSAIASDCQVAYRVVWTYQDEGGSIHVGPPSGRATLINGGVQFSPGEMVVVSGTATITPIGGHPFVSGQLVAFGEDAMTEPNIPVGDYTVVDVSSSSWFKINLGNGLNFTNTQVHRIGNAARDALVQVMIPRGVPAIGSSGTASGQGYYYEIYRSPASVNSDTDADDNLGLVFKSNVVTYLPSLDVTRADSTLPYVSATTMNGANHLLNVGDIISVASVVGGQHPEYFNYLGYYPVTSVISTSTFVYNDGQIIGWNPGWEHSTASAFPWTATVLDTVNDGLAGKSLYTNPNQQGILQENDAPPAAGDISLFKNSLFYGNIVGRQRIINAQMVTVTSSNPATGSDPNDTYWPGHTVYMSGTAYGNAWALNYKPTSPGSSSIDAVQGYYPVYTPGSPKGQTIAQSIALTAQGLVAAINRDSRNTYVRAYYTSAPDGVPGLVTFESLHPDASVSGTSFNMHCGVILPPINSSSADIWPNGLYWSKTQEYEATPLGANYVRIGQNDKPIQRLISLQNALVVIKEDGIWRLVGDGPFNFRVEVLDNTVRCIAPESCVSMNNKVYAFTEYGAVEITEQGVQTISTPIDDKIKNVINTAGRTAINDLAFGIADPEDRKYKLFLPTLSTDTKCNQAFVYDFYTQSWTRWVLNANDGIVPSNTHKVMLANDNGILAERKAGTYSDFVDYTIDNTSVLSGSGITYSYTGGTVRAGDLIVQGATRAWVAAVGSGTITLTSNTTFTGAPCTVLSAIPSVIAWTPKAGGNTAGVNQYREAGFAFRQGNFADNQTSVTFTGDDLKNAPASDTVYVQGASRYNLVGPNSNGPFRIRVGVPRNEQRCSELTVALNQAMAENWFQIQAMSITLNNISEKQGKR